MTKEILALVNQLDPLKLPQHVAIIMDGNGRWAKQRHRPRMFGHRAGARAVRQAVELSGELYIKHLTVYAFSTENWSRPQDEVSALMKLLMEYLNKEIDEMHRKNVVVRIIGSKHGVDPDFLAKAHDITRKTWDNTGLHFNVAFNYGGRQEITEAVQNIIVSGEKAENITSELISSYLYTKAMPDPDLVIRTSGEMRLSNFLIWQSAYSEIYITDTLWPDFDKKEYIKALMDFQARTRRFGGV